MPKHNKPVDPRQIVKIEAVELPQTYEEDEGLYDLRWAHDPDNYEMHSLITLQKVLQEIMPKRVDDILCRLQNFRVAYLNLATGEITS